MKNYTQTNYQVVAPDLSWKSLDKFETLKDAVEYGKAMNEREIKNGYKPSKWIVVKEMWSRSFDDNGVFVSESTGIVVMNIDAYM